MSDSSGSQAGLSGNVPSTKPYLIRALYEWCMDNSFTPFLAVFVDASVRVPLEYVKKDEIVLNMGPEACQGMQLDNEWISFQARFGGIPRQIDVPVTHVMAIYARENGQGMSFPVQIPEEVIEPEDVQTENEKGSVPAKSDKPKSHLKLVK